MITYQTSPHTSGEAKSFRTYPLMHELESCYAGKFLIQNTSHYARLKNFMVPIDLNVNALDAARKWNITTNTFAQIMTTNPQHYALCQFYDFASPSAYVLYCNTPCTCT